MRNVFPNFADFAFIYGLGTFRFFPVILEVSLKLTNLNYFQKPWVDRETDELIESFLADNADADKLGCLSLGGVEVERPFSDTSSDSGCNLEQQMMSPPSEAGTDTANGNQNNLDIIEYIANGQWT